MTISNRTWKTGIYWVFVLALAFPLEAQIVGTLANGFSASGGVTVDGQGNIFVGDFGRGGIGGDAGNTIYRITPDGASVQVYAQSNVLRGLTGGRFTPSGKLFWSSYSSNRVSEIEANGQVNFLATVDGPVALVAIDNDTLFAAECNNGAIVKIAPDGSASTFATSPLFSCPNGMTIDPDKNLYASDFNNGNITKITPNGNVSLLATIPGNSNQGRAVNLVYVDSALYVTARSRHQIYRVDMAGNVELFAGTGMRGLDNGNALQATFSWPNGIAVSPDRKRLYINDVAATAGSSYHPSVLRMIEFDTIGSIEPEDKQSLQGFELYQNYPNPFNPETTIAFELPKATDISLKIYNAAGKLVNVLLQTKLSGGSHQVTWDGKNILAESVPSGIYFYRLKANEFQEVKKMLLLQ